MTNQNQAYSVEQYKTYLFPGKFGIYIEKLLEQLPVVESVEKIDNFVQFLSRSAYVGIAQSLVMHKDLTTQLMFRNRDTVDVDKKVINIYNFFIANKQLFTRSMFTKAVAETDKIKLLQLFNFIVIYALIEELVKDSEEYANIYHHFRRRFL